VAGRPTCSGRPWLEFLAANPDERLSGNDIAVGIGMDPASVPGMLGAAERRWAVAEVVLKLAEK
jgi:hypothetical protein